MSSISRLDPPLRESYQACARIAKEQARNFYYSFMALPAEKHAAMCAIYAWMRHSDDISDEGAEAESTGDRAAVLQAWRVALDRAMQGDYGDSPVLAAFHDTVQRYGIPVKYFHQVIDGAEMDLSPRVYETFEDTRNYCYHVASVVGLVCIHVFEFSDPSAPELAIDNGIAFQLTNILRDLREDSSFGRIYLPREDLERFGYSEDDLRASRVNDSFRELMRFEVERTKTFYDRAAPLVAMINPDSRPCLRAMRQIYRGILSQIEAQNYDVFSQRASVPKLTKCWIAGGAWLRSRLAPKGSFVRSGGRNPSSV